VCVVFGGKMKRSAEPYKNRWKTAATPHMYIVRIHSAHPAAFLFGRAQILQSLARIRKGPRLPGGLTNFDLPMGENPGKKFSQETNSFLA
jgi:hypothetical protein